MEKTSTPLPFCPMMVNLEYWLLPNGFTPSIEMVICFLSFILLMCCITVIDLYVLKHPCIPGMNHTWSLYMTYLICLILFAHIFWEFLHLYSSGIWVCSFLIVFLPDLCIRVMLASCEEFGRIVPTSIFWIV